MYCGGGVFVKLQSKLDNTVEIDGSFAETRGERIKKILDDAARRDGPCDA